MQIHDLKRKNPNKRDRTVGRGGKHAKTSGRGGKGQTARAGNKRRPELRDIIKKLPKNRGYQFKSRRRKIVIQKSEIKGEKSFAGLRKTMKLKGGKIIVK